jgi:SAM-dependent methyltransferase
VELASLPVDDVDVVTSFEVIEHLFSPRAFLEKCLSLLPPGGIYVVTCPNVKGFDITVLGDRSMPVDTEHLNYMHPRSLGHLLETVGFEVLESQTPGRLDAELVRKGALAGDVDLDEQPFLREVLIEEWDRLGEPFQDFLAESGLSSHMWLVARAT